jgi:hypothetical protein
MPERPSPRVDPPSPPPAPAATTSAAPASTATLPAPVSAAAIGPIATCVIGSHPSITAGVARTAVGLVCEELERAGVRVSLPTTDPGGATVLYRVDIEPLGRIVIVRLTQEIDGTPQQSRRLFVSGLEEIPIAAPRLADALVHDKPLNDTARVDNLVSEETRRLRKKQGETVFGLGLIGLAVPAFGAVLGRRRRGSLRLHDAGRRVRDLVPVCVERRGRRRPHQPHGAVARRSRLLRQGGHGRLPRRRHGSLVAVIEGRPERRRRGPRRLRDGRSRDAPASSRADAARRAAGHPVLPGRCETEHVDAGHVRDPL